MRQPDYSIHYRRFHDDSAAHAERMAAWIANVLKPHLPVDRSTPIADIGCGFGFALRALRNLGYTDVTGVELSPQQAEHARAAGFTVDVTADTCAWLQQRRGHFGFIVLMDVLEHVLPSEQIKLTTSLYTALAPGGKTYLTVPNANSWLASRWRYIDHTHHSSFTEHSLYFVLGNAGFERIDIDNTKGLGPLPKALWRREGRARFRKWCVRWLLLQIFKAEIPWENLSAISFELNLSATATKLPVARVPKP